MSNNRRTIANFQQSPYGSDKDVKKIKDTTDEDCQRSVFIPELKRGSPRNHTEPCYIMHPNISVPIHTNEHREMSMENCSRLFHEDVEKVSSKLTMNLAKSGDYCGSHPSKQKLNTVLDRSKVLSVTELFIAKQEKALAARNKSSYKYKICADEGSSVLDCRMNELSSRCWYIKRPIFDQNLSIPNLKCMPMENIATERLGDKMQDVSSLKDYTNKYSLPNKDAECTFSNVQNLFSEGFAMSPSSSEKNTKLNTQKEKNEPKKAEQNKLSSDFPAKVGSKKIIRVKTSKPVKESAVSKRITKDIVKKNLLSKQMKTKEKRYENDDEDGSKQIKVEGSKIDSKIIKTKVRIKKEKLSESENQDRSKQIKVEGSKVDSKKIKTEVGIKKEKLSESENQDRSKQIKVEESKGPSEQFVEPNKDARILVPVINENLSEESVQDHFESPQIRTSIVKPLFSLPPNVLPIICCETPKLGQTDTVALCLDSQVMFADSCRSTCKVPPPKESSYKTTDTKNTIPLPSHNVGALKETLKSRKQYSPSSKPIYKFDNQSLHSPVKSKEPKDYSVSKGRSAHSISQINGFQSKKQNVTQKRVFDTISSIGRKDFFLSPTCCSSGRYSDTPLTKPEVESKLDKLRTIPETCMKRKYCQTFQPENKGKTMCTSFSPRECIKNDSKNKK